MKTEIFLNKIERKFRRYEISGIMNYIIIGMVIVFLMDAIICPMTGRQPLSPYITFDRNAIMHGQVWRLISFVFEPMSYSPFFLIFTLYFYWMIGNVLENNWGTFRFNLYVYISVLGAIIAGLITGYGTNHYLILTMFLAFAFIVPDMQILLFFFIPIKVKYIAYVDAAILILTFILSGVPGKIALLISLMNLFIFFGEAFYIKAKMRINHWKYKIKNRR